MQIELNAHVKETSRSGAFLGFADGGGNEAQMAEMRGPYI